MQASHADVLVDPPMGEPGGEPRGLVWAERGKDGYLHGARPILDEVSTRVHGGVRDGYGF
jgi:hypothetical protein